MKKIILFAIVLIVIASCKKSNNSSHTNGIHLSKFIELDTNVSAPADTLEEDIYVFDNSNRWIFESDLSFSSEFPGIAAEGERLNSTYHYLGSDTVPYLNTLSEYGQSIFQDSDVDYLLSYSAEGLVKDSEVDIEQGYPNESTTTQSQYNGSTIISMGISYPGAVISLDDTVTQTTANGNIITESDNDTYQGSNFTASYDTHPDPFPDAQLPGEAIASEDNSDFGQKNNLTAIIGIAQTGIPINLKYQYTYNSNGYPATVVEYDWSSGSPVFVYKGFYFYQ